MLKGLIKYPGSFGSDRVSFLNNFPKLRYKGVEEEMTLKIQVPWTEQGLPCTDRELWVYNQSRDFTFCVLPGDPNCGVIRDKILAEGLSCIRPGKKLYFRARLSEEFLLHVQLDSTVDAKW